MATRNERKRRAKARNEALEKAVQAAFRDDAERKRTGPPPLVEQFPVNTHAVGAQRIAERAGKVLNSRGKRKLISGAENPFGPLRHDGNASGYGQLRKKMVR